MPTQLTPSVALIVLLLHAKHCGRLQLISQGNEPAEINCRQRPMLKAAVKWFYTESEYASPNAVMYDRLLSQFQK